MEHVQSTKKLLNLTFKAFQFRFANDLKTQSMHRVVCILKPEYLARFEKDPPEKK